MNKSILAALLLAAVVSAPARAMGGDEFCATVRDMAYEVARERDRGTPMSDLRRIADEKVSNPNMNQMVKRMVSTIYADQALTPARAAALTLRACQSATNGKGT